MKTKIHYYLIPCTFLISIVLLQSFKKPNNEYVSIGGAWENFTIVKDEKGKEKKISGKNIFRKLKFVFEGAGTWGNENSIKKQYNMAEASGVLYFVESYGFKEKKYKDKDEEVIMNYGLQIKYRIAESGYYFDSDNFSSLKTSCGKLQILDDKEKMYIEYKKGDTSFTQIQSLMDKIKVKKLTAKKLYIEWDFDGNGKIDDDETLIFDSLGNY